MESFTYMLRVRNAWTMVHIQSVHLCNICHISMVTAASIGYKELNYNYILRAPSCDSFVQATLEEVFVLPVIGDKS